MSNRLRAGVPLAVALAWCWAGSAAEAPDYSKEAVVIQNVTTKISFAADGARERQQTVSVRIQSESAVRQYGVLAFSYGSANEQVKIDYVRVRKADGSVVETPDSSILDVASQVAMVAPMYSDIRQKQIPVKALGVGDVLEYSIHSSQRTPEVAGQFGYDHAFRDDNVVLNETLEIRVHKERYVQVSSPKLKPEIHEDGADHVYIWKHSHLEPSKPDDKEPSNESESPKVQITTFHNWEEVGSWWTALASPQALVTPAIQDKARELTAGLSSNTEKARAIYQYVSLKFRYISISFGEGRFRPHSAADVLANQYGDCKDKHTLFVALLKAAGIPAWPALIGAGVKFDDSVPSPAKFNHVITVLPQDGTYVWLDTTAEVAPFGLLSQVIRGVQALVMPSDGKPFLVKTPADPPFATSSTVTVKSSLSADGSLSGHFEFLMDGDAALLMRSGFRQFAPTQWQTIAQGISFGLGFAGEVSGVVVNNLETLNKPIQYSYDYAGKNYSDWAEHRITAPVPPMRFGPGNEGEKPKESFWVGDPGIRHYSASVALPKGFTVQLPEDATQISEFADYSSHYSVKDGTLFADRKMVIKKSKVTPEQWEAYQKFSKGLQTDQNRYFVLAEPGRDRAAAAPQNDPEAQEVMRRASLAVNARSLNEARDLLSQVELRNPKQSKLWWFYGYLAATSEDPEQAIADYRKEIQFHPDEIAAYQELTYSLMALGRREEAIEAWHGALAVKPENRIAAMQIATLLMQAKRYSEIPAVLDKPITAAPDVYNLQALRVEALLRSGQKDQGIAEAKKVANATSESVLLNDLAYAMLDTGSAVDVAQGWAQKASSQTEQDTAKASLASFGKKDLASVTLMAAEWDTVGWFHFKQRDIPKAEKYVEASWQLNQHAAVADHLGQIYDKQGRHEAAIHMWRLALAVNSKYDEARERLRDAGVPVSEPVTVGKNGKRIIPVFGGEELGKLRTFGVPALPKQTGSAEFFLLISSHGIDEAQFVSGLDIFKNAAPAIQTAKYEFPFPDAGPEKIIRRGILSCSVYTTPSCQFTMYLPSTVTATPLPAKQESATQNQLEQTGSNGVASASGVVPPTVRTKVEPDYSEPARQAKLEGKVVLSIVVNEDGIPEDISLIKSLGMGLDEKAEESVAKWRFNPATKAGKPVKSRAEFEINFVLIKQPQQ